MSFYKHRSFFVFLVIHVYSVVSGDSVNSSVAHSADKQSQIPPWSSVVVNSPVFQPALDTSFSLLLSSFPEDLEVNEYCRELLHLFGQRYVAHASCLVPAARPVRLCQNCFSTYASVLEIYNNISSNQVGPGNVSCGESLLHSDRLGLVSLLFDNVKTMWDTAVCSQCVKDSRGPTNDTLNYMANLNQTLTCFEKYQQGNHTELCSNCKNIYRDLNELYGRMEMNMTLCIDLDDAMNMTRKMWSTKFNCSLPREESVPVIAVSSFMLFLPIIFYLSSFLHSEQKKRKLIHPKRAKSYTSLMNIQDKQS